MPVSTAPLLAATYRRIEGLVGRPRIHPVPAGEWPVGGWLTGDQVCGPAGVAALVTAEEARIRAEYGSTARRDVAPTWALHRYARLVCVLLGGAYLLDRRVPLLLSGDVAVPTSLDKIAVVDSGFACLATDPAAAHDRARPMPNIEALRIELRVAVAAHLAPVLAAFRPRLRRGAAGTWGTVTDHLTDALWRFGRAAGDEDGAVVEAEALLPGRTPPYIGGADFRRLKLGDGRSELTRTTIACCLYYTLRPADACLTCPRTNDDERVRRLRDTPATTGDQNRQC